MIALLIVFIMTLETTFLDASAKHRNTWNAEIHRKKSMFPYTNEEYEDFFEKQK